MSIDTPQAPPRDPTGAVGTSVPRVGMRSRVAGTADYAANVERPGTLHVAVTRSTRPHARLLDVDTTRARAVDGVVEIVTGAMLVEMLGDRHVTGPAFQDQPILAHDRVRYAGEPFAAVVSPDPGLSRAAASLVVASYEDLEPVLDVDDAIGGPPYVHDELRPSKVFSDLGHLAGQRDTNVCYEFNLRHGDPGAAEAQAAWVAAGEYWTPPAQHVALELPCTLAWVEDDRLEVVSATQTPSYVRQMLADVLDLPLNRVRVRVPGLGASFGSKMYDKLEPLTAVLAWRLGRPVKWVATREEAFVMTSRHGVAVTSRMAADAQGRLVAADVDVRYDTGAYADIGPRLTGKSGLIAAGPYRLPNVRVRSRCVYTNKVSAGPFRGFGVPQLVWAHECTIDELARLAGADPYRFRRENLLREGDEAAVGTEMHSADLVGCLDAVAEALEWDRPLPAGDGRHARGRGIAVGAKAVLTPTTSGATVQLNQDASAVVFTNTVEMGQGSDTILSQIAAEVLSLPPESVRMARPDTDGAGYDTITAGSRTTYHMGNAVRKAAEDVRGQLLEMAAGRLGVDPIALRLAGGAVHGADGPDDEGTPIGDVILAAFGSRGTTLTGHATHQTSWIPYDPKTGRTPRATEHWFAGAVGVELTVDRLTGVTQIDHLAVAGDVGRAINPRLCEQQLIGAALMGVGHALFDEMVFSEGRLVNETLLDYQLCSVRDMPRRLTPLLVECPHRGGPFGAKGVGETGILATAPAIGNAVRDACGVRLTRLPLKPETVLEALGKVPA
jgi:CO/xanthine dehydrogenase Mo-binding subunit